MSVQAIIWALGYAAGSVTEKVLLLVLTNYANEIGVSWPSQKTLADQTALGERTVLRVLADMERRGVMRRIVRRRGKQSSFCSLCFNWPYLLPIGNWHQTGRPIALNPPRLNTVRIR